MKKNVLCPYGCGKLFGSMESIEKYHGWCAKKQGKALPPATEAPVAWDPMVALFERAEAAGDAAATGTRPVGMVVQQHAHPLDDNSPVIESWNVPEGVCGFATVQIKPATHKVCKAALLRYTNRNGLPGHPLATKDSYNGGIGISVMGYNQSMQRKEAYAHAYADVIKAAYFDLRVWVNARMD